MRGVWKTVRFIWGRISDVDTAVAIGTNIPAAGVVVLAVLAGFPQWSLIVALIALVAAGPMVAAFLKGRSQRELVQTIAKTRLVRDDVVLRWFNDIEKRSLGEIRFSLRHMQDSLDRMDRRTERLELWRDSYEPGMGKMPEEKPTAWTATGLDNRNGQINLGCPDPPRYGSNQFQYVFVMHCPQCDRNYGTDGIDLFERRCPYHQGGIAGLPLCGDEADWRPVGKQDG